MSEQNIKITIESDLNGIDMHMKVKAEGNFTPDFLSISIAKGADALIKGCIRQSPIASNSVIASIGTELLKNQTIESMKAEE